MLIDIGMPTQSWIGMGIMALLGLLYWLLRNFVNSITDRIKKMEENHDKLLQRFDEKNEKVEEIITAIRIKIGGND